jgi:hypothetical protein
MGQFSFVFIRHPFRHFPTMSKSNEPFNPFYTMLVVVGILFAITACAYCVMTVRGVSSNLAAVGQSAVYSPEVNAPLATNLMALLDRHGLWILLGQIGLLGVATFGAILTDDYWARRAPRRSVRPDILNASQTNNESDNS